MIMGLLDKIRNLISGSKSKALPISTSFSKTDIDKTMPKHRVNLLEVGKVWRIS